MTIRTSGFLFILLCMGYNACKSTLPAEEYQLEYPRWIGDTAYQLKVDGTAPIGKNLQASENKACADAMNDANRKFSELIVPVRLEELYCPPDGCPGHISDWKYRLRPDIFTFKAREVSRRTKIDGKHVGCRVVAEYADANLRQRTEDYAKKIRSGE